MWTFERLGRDPALREYFDVSEQAWMAGDVIACRNGLSLCEERVEVGCEVHGCFPDGGSGAVSFLVEAGHGDAVEAAGSDELEGWEGFRGDVEGEAVHGDPLFDADAEGGDLA